MVEVQIREKHMLCLIKYDNQLLSLGGEQQPALPVERFHVTGKYRHREVVKLKQNMIMDLFWYCIDECKNDSTRMSICDGLKIYKDFTMYPFCILINFSSKKRKEK